MIYTTAQVAERFGVKPRAVRALAQRHGIGTDLNSRTRIYSDEDVARIAERIGKRGHHIGPKSDRMLP